MNPREMAGLYRTELLETVVPFWERHGIDHEHGGFFTCLDRDGRHYGTEKYMWLQGRAVWMFARLHNNVSRGRGWLDLARQGADFARRFGRDPVTGRVYFSLTRDGKPVYLQRKIFSEAFYVLAMTEMARATAEESYLAEAKEVFWLAYDLWRHPAKLGRPILPGTPRGSKLAEPMVFLSMIEELVVLDNDPRYEDVVHEMKRVALRHVKPDQRRVFENVGPEGELADSPAGRLLSPGHALELAWFLIHLAQRTGEEGLIPVALEMVNWSFEAGWDEEFGGLYYYLDAEGRPPAVLEWSMKLWWPMAEALYATLLAWKTSGDEYYLELHRKTRAWAWARFRDPEFGEWFGYLDRRGERTHDLKGGPWKGFFHLPRALLYSAELLDAVAEAERIEREEERRGNDS